MIYKLEHIYINNLQTASQIKLPLSATNIEIMLLTEFGYTCIVDELVFYFDINYDDFHELKKKTFLM